jgi:hypothetical protein
MVGNDGAQVNLIQTIPGFGDAADRLIANDFDIGVLRPWVGGDGRHYHARTMGGKTRSIVTNTPATLTKEAWVLLDQAVVRAVRARLRAFADIRAAGLVFNLPNGMAHTVLQYQTVSDITSATVSMDPIRRSERDRPVLDLLNLPLPVVHKDFDFSAREIAVSRNGNVPLDTTMAELAGRKVAEEVEKMTVGNVASAFAYGGGAIYGYTNFPNRSTKFDVTVPTSSNGPTVLNDILALRHLLQPAVGPDPGQRLQPHQGGPDLPPASHGGGRLPAGAGAGLHAGDQVGLHHRRAHHRDGPSRRRHGDPDGAVGEHGRDDEAFQGDGNTRPPIAT